MRLNDLMSSPSSSLSIINLRMEAAAVEVLGVVVVDEEEIDFRIGVLC